MNFEQSIIFGLITLALGIAATWYYAWYYFMKADKATDRLIQVIEGNHQRELRALTAVAHMLEKSGSGEGVYDEAGHLVGVVVKGYAHLIVTHQVLKGTGTASGPGQYDRQHEQPNHPKVDNADA